MSRPKPAVALRIVGDAMRARADDWNAHPGLRLKANERSTVSLCLGRHKFVAWASPRSDGATWDVLGSVEIFVKHDESDPLRAERLHGEHARPLFLAAGLSPTCGDSSVDSEGGVDWFRAVWAGSTSDPTALAAMLLAFLAVETDWRPDGRIDWDSYRPLNLTDPEPRMSVFCYPALGRLTGAALVLRAVGTPSLTAGDVVVLDRSGPPIAGRSACWATWRLREGAADGLCTSILDEGDPDDPDFATRDGVVAWVDGTTTAYLACRPLEERPAEHELMAEIVAAAAHPFFAPNGTSATPIPDAILGIRDAVILGLRARNQPVCASGSSPAVTVYATTGWVQIDVPGVGAILLTPATNGTLEAHLLPEAEGGGADGGGVVYRGLTLAAVIDRLTDSFSAPP